MGRIVLTILVALAGCAGADVVEPSANACPDSSYVEDGKLCWGHERLRDTVVIYEGH